MGGLARSVKALWKDNSGATSIEYAFLAALIAMAIILGATSIGNELAVTLDGVGDELAAANAP